MTTETWRPTGRLARSLVLAKAMERATPLRTLPQPVERRQLREPAGFTQLEVAFTLDVKEKTFAYWEAERVMEDRLPDYLKALGAFAAFEGLGLRSDDAPFEPRKPVGTPRGGRRPPYASWKARTMVKQLATAPLTAEQLWEKVNAECGSSMSLEAVKRMRARERERLAGRAR